MKKGDLQNGMVVKLRDGSINLVLKDSIYGNIIIDLDNGSYINFNNYDNDMNCVTSNTLVSISDLDIVSVYKPFDCPNFWEDVKPIWTRTTKRKVTMSELREVYGCDIEIVEE